jgi:hypothetical protein
MIHRNRHLTLRLMLALALVGATLGVLVQVQGSSARPVRHARRAAAKSLRGPQGPQGPRGPVGPVGPAGPAGPAGPNIGLSLTINWTGVANAPGNDTATATDPAIGTLTATCNGGDQQIVLAPAQVSGVRTVADVTTFQGEGTQGISSNQRLTSEGNGSPITIPLPTNGMIVGTVSLEPIGGTGGPEPDPVTLTVSSQWKLNDPTPANDYCYIAGQALQ